MRLTVALRRGKAQKPLLLFLFYCGSFVYLVVTCAHGTEKALAFELSALGVPEPRNGTGAVHVDLSSHNAPADVLAAINLKSRIASRVLWRLALWENMDTPERVVEMLDAFAFEKYLTRHSTISVAATLRDCPWQNSHYAALRVKDAICDRMRAVGKDRPNVDLDNPTFTFVLHWHGRTASLLLDTTGDPLHQRRYRSSLAKAPLRENLAAAILAIAHADTARPFMDPCCGSGTLAIEQALRALRWYPSIARSFAVENWPTAPATWLAAFKLGRAKIRDEQLRKLPAPILLSDWHPDAIASANDSISRAGLTAFLEPQRFDARKAPLPSDKPVVCTNLPYGERMSDQKNRLQLDGFFRTLAETWLKEARSNDVGGARIITLVGQGNAGPILADVLGQKYSRWALRNGDLPTTLVRWDIYPPRDPADAPR